MSDRDIAVHAFIQGAGWGDATVGPLAGDASNRRYLRLTREGETAVVMDAPKEKGEDIRPFLHIAGYLSGIGLSAPAILASDEAQGFILLEDLGDDLFARVIPKHPEMENSLYACATDLLAELHRHAPPPDLAPYDAAIMADMAALAFDWYLTAARGENTVARAEFHGAITAVLDTLTPMQTVLIQRDYHSENLLWLPDRRGVARVGLLDFQDAMLGHPAYDLVSLLQDARRYVPPDIESQMIARYVQNTQQDHDAFTAAYHALGAQRNLRILGVFARLCVRDGKAHYVDLIPRVWDLLQRDLTHPALQNLSALVHTHLPAPTNSLLKTLKDKCATIPSQS
ncbi:aminoglycoside phosphotransferase family protein [Roseovarius sp. 2305UL8-3]|uniref:aminoglycoside phosphotransferase family protein n=1 Tax=Roseovarius conchicola TaxID=3121636 RepID=UPI00352863A3